MFLSNQFFQGLNVHMNVHYVHYSMYISCLYIKKAKGTTFFFFFFNFFSKN